MEDEVFISPLERYYSLIDIFWESTDDDVELENRLFAFAAMYNNKIFLRMMIIFRPN